MPRIVSIRLRGDTGIGVMPVPAGPHDREPIFARGGFDATLPTHVSGNELAIFNGAGYAPLVSARRQVELIGVQEITGLKTFHVRAAAPSLRITGGTAGQVLSTTDPVNGILEWTTPPARGPTYTWGRGLGEAPPGTVNLDFASDTAIGGVFVTDRAAGLILGAGTGQLDLAPAGNSAALFGGVFVTGRAAGLVLGAGGQLALGYAGVDAANFGGVFVPAAAPAPGPGSTHPSGLLLTATNGDLRIAIASAGTLGGVSVPVTPPGVAGGLELANTGQLTIRAAGDVAAARGSVFVTGPGLGLGPAHGQLSLVPGTGTAIGGVSIPPAGTGGSRGGLAIGGGGEVTLVQAGAGVNNLGGVYVPGSTSVRGGLVLEANGELRVFPAVAADAATGTDSVKPITSAVLQLGPTLGVGHPSLPTTNQTILGSIAELYRMIIGATGQLTLVGTFNADTLEVSAVTGSPHDDGVELETAAQSNLGWFLLVDTEGTPDRADLPQPPKRMVPGDMIISVEDAAQANTYHWGHLGIGQAQVTASNVVLTAIPTLPGIDNVQDAIEELEVKKADRPLLVDGVSLAGDGQTTDLEVAIVDGGTF